MAAELTMADWLERYDRRPEGPEPKPDCDCDCPRGGLCEYDAYIGACAHCEDAHD